MKMDDLERVSFAQGWITNQIEQLEPKDEQEQVVYGQWKEMWSALNGDIDSLVKDSLKLTEMEEKLAVIKALTRTPVEQKLEQIGSILDT
jgi:hypothetical protein